MSQIVKIRLAFIILGMMFPVACFAENAEVSARQSENPVASMPGEEDAGKMESSVPEITVKKDEDEIFAKITSMRQENFSDEVILRQLKLLEEPAEEEVKKTEPLTKPAEEEVEKTEPPTEESSFWNDVFFWGIVCLLLLILMPVVLLALKRNTDTESESSSELEKARDKYIPVGRPKMISRGNKSEFIRGIFPTEWFESVDIPKMEDFRLDTENSAVSCFFKTLGDDIPTSETLKDATENMGVVLNKSITDPKVYVMFNGGNRLDKSDTDYLTEHLNELMPSLRIPLPQIVEEEVQWWAMSIIAAVGALFGFIFFGTLTYWGMNNAGMGQLLGTIIGASSAVALGMVAARHEEIRRWLIIAVGTAATMDFIVQMLKRQILPPWLAKNSFWKRAAFYVLAIFCLLLVKRQKTYDAEAYKKVVGNTADLWIRSMFPIIAVLMQRPKEPGEGKGGSGGEDLLSDLTREFQAIHQYQSQASGKELEYAIAGMTQEFEMQGVVFPDTLPSGTSPSETDSVEQPSESSIPKIHRVGDIFIWSHSFGDSYKVFGLAKEGQKVVVQETPVIRDGEVVKKGLVIRYRD